MRSSSARLTLPRLGRGLLGALLGLATLAGQALSAGEIAVSGQCPLQQGGALVTGDTLSLAYHEGSPGSSLLEPPPAYTPCEQIRFDGSGSGKPPLILRWLLDSALFATGPTATISTRNLAPGLHTMTFEVANSVNTARRSVSFSVQPLSFLLPPTYVSLGGNAARFEAQTTGATEWQWTWGDGAVSPWLPGCEGYAPSHGYALPGTYTVRVAARNCRDAAISSASFPVTVTLVLAARVLRFEATNCPFGFCIFPTNLPILFDQAFAGAPTSYRYDWNGDGTYDEISPTPIAAHAFPAPGFYTPVLQVADATTTHTYRHAQALSIQGSTLPPPATPTGLALELTGYELGAPPYLPPGDVWTVASAIVALRWSDRSGDESGFNVYQSRDGGAFELVATIGANTTLLVGRRLALGSRYTFRVTAFGPGGESAASTTVSLDLRPEGVASVVDSRYPLARTASSAPRPRGSPASARLASAEAIPPTAATTTPSPLPGARQPPLRRRSPPGSLSRGRVRSRLRERGSAQEDRPL